ncbi:MAG: hypothetical protein V2I45_09335 [Halieaceae bacterium]|jgi:hypothetical protein|nr:hypothetical protein [Halieaceae bacterium]
MKRLMTIGLMLLALPAAARDIDADSGLVIAPGFTETKQNCTVCHSAKLITQSRADRDGWLSMIRWMQKTQNLWPLGPNEPVILDYLAENYAPESIGRRPNLPAKLMPPE